MALNIGIRYAMAGNAEGLAERRREVMGPVPVRLELKNGQQVVGLRIPFICHMPSEVLCAGPRDPRPRSCSVCVLHTRGLSD